MALKWVSNTVNPENLDLDHVFLRQKDALKDDVDLISDIIWFSDIDLLSDKVIGRPKANDKYSVEELEARGIVGVYEELRIF